jgi:hypothetical protein
VRDRYVEIDPGLTQPVEIIYAPPGDVDTIDLRVMYESQREQAKMCNGQLASIAAIMAD